MYGRLPRVDIACAKTAPALNAQYAQFRRIPPDELGLHRRAVDRAAPSSMGMFAE
jgi:hypothetical protein